MKMKLYEVGEQYNNKADLWEAIKTTMSETESTDVKKINKINNRLLTVIEKKVH